MTDTTDNVIQLPPGVTAEAPPRRKKDTRAAGKPWMSVILRSGEGDAAQFVQVAVFGWPQNRVAKEQQPAR
jgi:hypothetical protein